MSTKTLTPKRYEATLQAARAKHDAYFETANPRPTLADQQQADQQLTPVEHATKRLWVIWAILAAAGAIISAPHTIAALLGVVDLPTPWSWGYALAGFIGVECALLGLGVVSALVGAGRAGEGKQSSVLGAINALVVRVGFRPVFDLAHLPNRRPATGALLVVALFAAALVFNLGDALQDAPFVRDYADQFGLAAKLAAGLLGPGLLLLAGHRFAHEVISAGAGRRDAQHAHERAFVRWEAALNASWDRDGEQWINQELAAKGYLTEDQEQAAGPFAMAAPVGTNGKRHG